MTRDDVTPEQVLETVRGALEDAEVEFEPGVRDGELVVSLPGERKLKTVASLVIGEHDLAATAFVIRHPDENEQAFNRHLLRRNLRMTLLTYAVDDTGDVYVRGRIPLRAVTKELVDQLLGMLLEAADDPFNELLLLGFRSSMQKEWDWRVSRGESLRNLEAFRSVLQREGDPGA